MLTRIRNASNAKHATVDIPASNMKKSIADILVEEGYIKSYEVIDDGKQGTIRVTLKYLGKTKVLSPARLMAARAINLPLKSIIAVKNLWQKILRLCMSVKPMPELVSPSLS